MQHVDEAKLGALLDAGKFDEATSYVQSLFAEPVSQAERSDAAIEYALMRMRLLNRINRRYLESVDGIIRGVEKVSRAFSMVADKQKLSATRAQLA